MTEALTGNSGPEPARSRGETLGNRAARRFFRNKAATVSLGIIVLMTVASMLGPMLSPHEIDTVYWDFIGHPPDFANGFYLGTDENGRDLLSRILFGARISLMVGVTATIVSVIVGLAYGGIAGYAGGRIDNLMMRFVEILYAMPFMFLVMLLMVLFGRNIFLIFVAIGAIEWMDVARITRGEAIRLRNQPFVQSAEILGPGAWYMVRRHLLPNSIGPILVYMTLLIPKVILLESFLSFLGLGVQEPLTSWGVLISDGARLMETSPWLLIFPALFLGVTLLAFNFLGDGLRDALDPKTDR